jgi:hypothetical protein
MMSAMTSSSKIPQARRWNKWRFAVVFGMFVCGGSMWIATVLTEVSFPAHDHPVVYLASCLPWQLLTGFITGLFVWRFCLGGRVAPKRP